jgi:negative regulator of sigma F NrsF-like protein
MTPPPVDPVLLDRIAGSLRSDLRPVRPLPSAGWIVAGLVALFVCIALAGASVLGFYGFHRLTPGAIALIFPPLAGLALLAAAASANATIPGSKRPLHPAVLMAAGCLLMESIFALLFRDYRTDLFVRQGTACLKAGLMWAAPTAVGVWLILRHGFAVNQRAAGLAMGTLAGFAGLTVLELHCPNFRMPHIVVWHVAVVPIAALAGYFLASKRRAAELMQ